jgi:hypothetical protein
MTISEFFKLESVPYTDYEITIPPSMPPHNEKVLFENSTANPCENILSFAHSTAGVDGCSAHTTTSNELVVIGYQFSRSDSSDSLSYQEVVEAYKRFAATINARKNKGSSCSYLTYPKSPTGAQWLAGRNVKPILVVICARTVPKFKTQLLEGITILSRTDIGRLLTPSLDIYQHYFQTEKLRYAKK